MFLFFSMICNNQLKKLSSPDYFKILAVLNIKEDLVINSNAKFATRKRTQRMASRKKKKKTISPKAVKHKNQSITYRLILRRWKWFRNFKEDRNQEEKNGVFPRMIKNCLS